MSAHTNPSSFIRFHGPDAVPGGRRTHNAVLHLDCKGLTANGVFSGYASLFHRKDLGRDVILPGAFRTSLARKRPEDIKMLFQHDPAEPIGQWMDIREDAKGLHVTGRLLANVVRAQTVRALMQEGVIDGLSIGFQTVKGRTDKKSGTRYLMEVDLWEISVVTFPMLPEARIHKGVAHAPSQQAADIWRDEAPKTLPTLREFERWLTQDAGLTRKQARTIIRSGYRTLLGTQDAADMSIMSKRHLHDLVAKATQIIRNAG